MRSPQSGSQPGCGSTLHDAETFGFGSIGVTALHTTDTIISVQDSCPMSYCDVPEIEDMK